MKHCERDSTCGPGLAGGFLVGWGGAGVAEATGVARGSAFRVMKMKMKKWVLRILLGVVVLMVVAVVGLYLGLDGLVRFGVERGANHATQQTTSLESAKVSIGEGTVRLVNLGIDNPPAYGKSKFLMMKDCVIGASIGSLFTDTVQVDRIEIQGLEISLQQNGLKSNLSEVLAACQSTTPAAGGAGAPTAPGKKLNVHLITLTGTKVDVDTFVR